MGYSFVRNRNLNFYNTKLPPASSLLRQRLMIVKQVNSIKKTKIDRTFYNLFNLKKLKANKFASLSEGEKQKVFISRLMSFEQDILIMDEPNQNLDIESEEKFFEKLSDLSKSKTIIMSLHDMNYIKKLADNLIILDSGKIIFNDYAANY